MGEEVIGQVVGETDKWKKNVLAEEKKGVLKVEEGGGQCKQMDTE